MRFISKEANECLGHTIQPKANFSLFFNKWLDYKYEKGKYVPTVAQHRAPLVQQARQSAQSASAVLKTHHARQAEYCQTMEAAGWKSIVFTVRLVSPFVSGLGAAHPTKTGMVLDHTSGVPYIPAASQKGVLRIAHIINSLRQEDGSEKALEQLLADGVITISDNGEYFWQEDEASRTLFGYSAPQDALAGQLVVLDAYPLTPPELGEEILNPHFPDYYRGQREPTEDQSPIPVKFLVVKPGVKFVLRVLLRLPYAKAPFLSQEQLVSIVKKNIRRAVTETGMGAKTALGFGRFTIIQEQEPDEVKRWIKDYEVSRKRARDKIIQAIEDMKYPWRKTLRCFGVVTDWGTLKQVLDDSELVTYQTEREVGEAVAGMAKTVASKHKKKWDQERDRKVAEWLLKFNIQWTPLCQTESTSSPPGPETDSQLLETIKGFPDEKKEGLKQFKAAKIKINKLDKKCAEALKAKFRKWKLQKSKTKSEEKLYKNIETRIKKLSD